MAIGYYILMGYWQCVLACTKINWCQNIWILDLLYTLCEHVLGGGKLLWRSNDSSTQWNNSDSDWRAPLYLMWNEEQAVQYISIIPAHTPCCLQVLSGGPFALAIIILFANIAKWTIQAASFIIPWFAYFSYLWEPIFMIQNLASGYTYMYIHTYIHLHLSYMYDQLLLGSTLLYMVRLAQEKT